jgi:prepilin-type N-terminal cleavage/methylation domain-containing protein/prepilin-type processing-associated H-X9-DG protein
MHMSSTSTGNRRSAFTLVELLVVVGVIAVLISLLLPSLTKVRRQAATVQCASNMKQVAMGIIQYSSSNRGALPPAFIQADTTRTVYPDGWWFATDLVRLKWLSAPNVYPVAGGLRDFAGNSVFRCPEGVIDTISAGGGAGAWPTDNLNNAYALPNATREQTLGFGVASWYMLNTGVNTNSNRLKSSATTSTPFVTYTRNNTNAAAPLDDAALSAELGNAEFARKITMMRRAGEMVMVVEAASTNWVYAGYTSSGGVLIPTDPTNQVPRLGARHGKVTSNGRDASTNLAFFDGHVATYPTRPLSTKGIATLSSSTIFFVGLAR